jgi:GTPase SAR1 family protein
MEPVENVSELTIAIAQYKIKELFKYLPTPEYLTGFQKWFDDRMADWEKTAMRIGLVGITSAGKSTFINAMAGEDILPRGAQPTSGVLVICRHSRERKLSVLFKNDTHYDFDGEDCNAEWLSRYADEKENPHNEQNVKEIHLSLPGLMIPDRYDLIDSPGLDAFGLEGHEELTLRTLIPLVDIVLFLTTTKSTSDKENLRALGKICKEAKPAIVIQTHKDAIEPRYSQGGKIVETVEQVLDKHRQRVAQLLEQTVALKNAPIIQVSSIEALQGRLSNPDVETYRLPAWEDSGFSQIEEALGQLQENLAEQISARRMKLLYREIQQLFERVRADYNSTRGKLEEAESYKQAKLNELDRLQSAIPSEKNENFPDAQHFQDEIAQIKDYIEQECMNRPENELESLNFEVRDKIKTIEHRFFDQADELDAQLQSIASELSVDLEDVKIEMQDHPSLPQLQHYEQMVEVEMIQQVGMVGTAKRIFGKLLNKDKWGYKEKEVTRTFVDREALKEDLSDYHAIYTLRLVNYLKSWQLHWVNSVAMLLSAISQKKDDLCSTPIDIDPEKYKIFLSKVRALKEWFEEIQKKTCSNDVNIHVTEKKHTVQTFDDEDTAKHLPVLLPLLQATRTINFMRKTHRFLNVVKQISKKECPTVLISTPFTQELLNYLSILCDLPEIEERRLQSRPILFTKKPISWMQPEKMPEQSRTQWFFAEAQFNYCT